MSSENGSTNQTPSADLEAGDDVGVTTGSNASISVKTSSWSINLATTGLSSPSDEQKGSYQPQSQPRLQQQVEEGYHLVPDSGNVLNMGYTKSSSTNNTNNSNDNTINNKHCIFLLCYVYINVYISFSQKLTTGNALANSCLVAIEAVNICACIVYLRLNNANNDYFKMFNANMLKILTAVVIVNVIMSAAIIVTVINLHY